MKKGVKTYHIEEANTKENSISLVTGATELEDSSKKATTRNEETACQTTPRC